MGHENNIYCSPVVVGFELYHNGTCKVMYEAYSVPDGTPKPKRGVIKYLSQKSRNKLALVVTETQVRFRSILTLTWPKVYPRDGREVKKLLNRVLNWIRRNLECEYLWFLEFQARGAPHIHILLETEVRKREKLANYWSRVVTDDESERRKVRRVHSHSRQWQNVQKPDGARRYATKYATKTEQKTVPLSYQNVGRFWGASRTVTESIPEPQTLRCTEWSLRMLLAGTNHRCKNWQKIPSTIFGVNR